MSLQAPAQQYDEESPRRMQEERLASVANREKAASKNLSALEKQSVHGGVDKGMV
jgi:hypothetical protein